MARRKEPIESISTTPRSLDLLGLDGIVPISAEVHKWYEGNDVISEMTVVAEATCVTPPICSCGTDKRSRSKGIRTITINDIPHGRTWVKILLRRTRYRCPSCGKYLQINPECIHDKHHMTRRLLKEIQILGLDHTYVAVEQMTGVKEDTVGAIIKKFIKRLDEKIPIIAPEVIGVDEVHAGKPMKPVSLVVTDIGKRQLLEISENGRKKENVISVFKSIGGHNRVRYGVGDMCKAYHDAMATCWPGLKTIVDKRHVQIKSREAMNSIRDLVRSELRNKSPDKNDSAPLYKDRGIINKRRHQLNDEEANRIEEWMETYPLLATAYNLKEGYFDLYNHKSFDDAMKAFEEWSKSIPGELEEKFGPVRNNFINHQGLIKNYFDTGKKYTNAYTEAANGLIKKIKKDGRGYNPEVLRAKALHKHGRWHERAIIEHLDDW